MGFLSVVVAGIAGFVFGAIWYTALGKPWMAASGVALDETGQPANRTSPVPYVTGLVAAILVAGMMRHVFALSGIDTFGEGLVSGLGIGLFMSVPWLATNYAFAGRPVRLTVIDGGYAVGGSAAIGAVLTLF